jgi:hypothetical protein
VRRTLAQRCRVVVKEDAENGQPEFIPLKAGRKVPAGEESFIFRGGCTLIFDLNDLKLKHAISKPILDPAYLKGGSRKKAQLNTDRLRMQYNCQFGDLADKMGFAPDHQSAEPFAFIHQSKEFSL